MVSVCVQHHPARILSPQLARYEVVADPDPEGPRSAIRTYLECLRRSPADATWRVVLQDDVLLHPNFDTLLAELLAERHGDVVALFVAGRAPHGKLVVAAASEQQRWAQLSPAANWIPTVALAWPAHHAADFLVYGANYVARRAARRLGTIGDDPVVGAWSRARRVPVWACVPSIVEHPDIGASLVKHREYNGQNRARRAAVFDGT